MKKIVKISCLLLVATLVVVSQMNLNVFAINFSNENEQTDIQASENNTEDNKVETTDDTAEDESNSASVEDAPLMTKLSPFLIGLASFDGYDLNGDNNLSYSASQAFGTTSGKSLNVSAVFPDSTTPNKQIIVALTKDFKFDNIEGFKTGTTVFDASTLPDQLKGVVLNATYFKNTDAIPAINSTISDLSGYVVYDVIASASKVDLQFTVSMVGTYLLNNGNMDLVNPISVRSVMDNVAIDEEVVENIRFTSPLAPKFWGASSVSYMYADQVDNIYTNKDMYFYTTGLNNQDSYGILYEQWTVKYSYPKQLTLENVYMNNSTNNITTIVDESNPTLNYVTITAKDFLTTGKNFYFTFTSDGLGVAGETYKVTPVKVNGYNSYVKPYGAAEFGTNAGLYTFTINIQESYKNKAEVFPRTTKVSLQNADSGAILLGTLPIRNTQADSVTDQSLKVDFDTTMIGVTSVYMRSGIKAYNITGITTDGRVFIFPDVLSSAPDKMLSLFANADITPNKEEYIASLSWDEVRIPGNFISVATNESAASAAYSQAMFYGDILPSAESGKSVKSVFTITNDGDFSGSNAQSANITSSFSSSGEFRPNSSTTSVTLLGGETKTVSGNFSYNHDNYNFWTSSMKGFNFYLRELDGIYIDASSLKITDSDGTVFSSTDGNAIISDFIDNSGVKVYKIYIPTARFDFNSNLKKIGYNFDIKALSTSPSIIESMSNIIQELL
ncbi:adhesive domain-containing protein [Culicoidibacter larvae]|uniref:Putative adhesive domain-containing protein n=1 Tax=Culicoidibacter larvae TaxID=2579976 RepID=A0A5R8QG31_9FIRM|nr:adhesive domain-containing protein [Culicoidibacter larvae]TLG76744.1 hypothetical protein FEZ08_03770 [Culicoidibacter larvae]